ncbi:MAG: hypothetical protein M3015_12775 [Bacteroidota bacterium]|nr:hypothetical protein [Bacteroidota bacterium]
MQSKIYQVTILASPKSNQTFNFLHQDIYLMGSEWIIKQYENQKYKKAWENLYKHQEKANQKMMQRIIDLE